MPRGIYGRAALIMLLPIVTLQLVISVVFAQRHFEGVTRQMVANISNDIKLIQSVIRESPDAQAAMEALGPMTVWLAFQAEFVTEDDLPAADSRDLLDFSGITVIDAFRRATPETRIVDLASDLRRATVYLDTSRGLLKLTFHRGRVSASNPHQLLVFMVFTALVMTGIAFIFLRNQLRPIRRLARAAEAFGRGRIVPYAPSGAIEVRAAGQAFLDMRRRIERQIEQRTLLLSGVSHDLRTPLTRIRLALSLMEDAPEVQEILRDVEDMERMINEFLAFARGDQAETMARTDPAALARAAVADAARGGLAIDLAVVPSQAGDVPEIVIRPNAMRRALDNLILNAGRYGHRIRVSVVAGARSLSLVVEDDGPGIPEDRREEATRPFTRLDAARGQDVGPGVGLGLAIARDIARSHGGRLVLERSADLGGLRAAIVLPL